MEEEYRREPGEDGESGVQEEGEDAERVEEQGVVGVALLVEVAGLQTTEVGDQERKGRTAQGME